MLCVTIVIILIMNYNLVYMTNEEYLLFNEEDKSKADKFFSWILLITVIQLLLNNIIYLFSTYERWSISMYSVQTGAKKIIIFKKESGLRTNLLDKMYYGIISFFQDLFKLELVQERRNLKFFVILFNYDYVYHVLIIPFIVARCTNDNIFYIRFQGFEILGHPPPGYSVSFRGPK
jgi:hypothetical protein